MNTFFLIQHVMSAAQRVGFIGLGIMGTGMANNLLKSGRNLVVWNRSPEKLKSFAALGATIADTPRAVVEMCDVTYSCLTTPDVARQVHFANDTGTIMGITQGKALVECSTLDAPTMMEIERMTTQRQGVFLEAPVSGSKGPANDV
jgi:3-hydroxyisobutyrate dehydrogenase-like beta-hydroxyacid dehydrogenase